MIVPDGIVELAGTAWLGIQGWGIMKVTALDKKLAVIGERLKALENENRKS